VLLSGSLSMADRTDHIAFLKLCQEAHSGGEHRAARGQTEPLGCRVAMIEVHLVRLEKPPAIGAGHLTQIPKECDRSCLASLDSSDLAIAMPTVIRYVGRTLARAGPHRSV
jgi:hypothetical protein